MSLRSLLFIPGLALVFLAAGCGGGGGPVETLVPVGGTLLVDGEPMEGVLVTFIPDIAIPGANMQRRGGSGKTDDSGAFTITHDGQKQPGLAAGRYTVAYSRMRLADGSAAPELEKGQEQDPDNIQIETFPVHLKSPDTKDPANFVEIPADGNTDVQLKVSTKAPNKMP